MQENRKLVMLADSDIAGAIKCIAAETSFAECLIADTYSECLDIAEREGVRVFILQARAPVAYIDDLLAELQGKGFSPTYVIFERTAPRRIDYAATVGVSSEAVAAEELFCTALQDTFIIRRTSYRSTHLNDEVNLSAESAGRHESLLEILRGCNEQEFVFYKETYKLDLRDDGYYMFFWELMGTGFADHERNKFIYNFSGKLLLRECIGIIGEYCGGEAFYIIPDILCIIINDLEMENEQIKKTSFKEMIRRLGDCTGNKTACRYLTERISDVTAFRDAYARYISDKAFSFFLKDAAIMSPALIAGRKQHIADDIINGLLNEITGYLRYDIMNPLLDSSIRRLYLEVLKPSISFTLYYSAIAAIDGAIREVAYSFDSAGLGGSLNIQQVSSIEEQLDALLRRLDELRTRHTGTGRIKSSVVLKALKFISENYSRDLSVSDISGALFISGAYLSQMFKRQMGCGVKKYLITYRIEQAKRQLLETDDFIYAIAENVGFYDFRHFSRSFKALTGMSPSRYRKKFLKD